MVKVLNILTYENAVASSKNNENIVPIKGGCGWSAAILHNEIMVLALRRSRA